jgi:folate-binding protein YgfZ
VSDNLSKPTPPLFPLPDLSVVALEGLDSNVFAHSQFANDTAGLAVGQWQWNAWLNPKGRVIALFALIKTGPERILLLLQRERADGFVAELRKFVFRRKLTIETLPELRIQGAFAAPAKAHGPDIADMESAGLELDFGSAEHPRMLRIGATRLALGEDVHMQQRWTRLDMSFGLPWLPESQYGQWTPQQLSLQRLPAFSVQKGCYPGQEIVARTHFLGKVKRELAHLRTNDPVAVGDRVMQNDIDIGEVVCVIGPSPWQALAVVPAEREPGEWRIGGRAVTELPLLPGLER